MTETTATSNNSELWHHPLKSMGAGIGDASFMYSHDDEIIDNTVNNVFQDFINDNTNYLFADMHRCHHLN